MGMADGERSTAFHEEDSLAAQVGGALKARGWRVSTAESCTGGLVAQRLTAISGSSAYVHGGLVAYDNSIKMRVLGVQAETLAAFGAVSREAAAEMAQGALALFQTDVAVSITGIAGPDGGTPEKPVGLVYIGVATAAGMNEVERHLYKGDRAAVRWQSATRALELLLAAAE